MQCYWRRLEAERPHAPCYWRRQVAERPIAPCYNALVGWSLDGSARPRGAARPPWDTWAYRHSRQNVSHSRVALRNVRDTWAYKLGQPALYLPSVLFGTVSRRVWLGSEARHNPRDTWAYKPQQPVTCRPHMCCIGAITGTPGLASRSSQFGRIPRCARIVGCNSYRQRRIQRCNVVGGALVGIAVARPWPARWRAFVGARVSTLDGLHGGTLVGKSFTNAQGRVGTNFVLNSTSASDRARPSVIISCVTSAADAF